jgi:hypothetical protein
MRGHWYQMLAWAEIEDEVEFEDDWGDWRKGIRAKKHRRQPATGFLWCFLFVQVT